MITYQTVGKFKPLVFRQSNHLLINAEAKKEKNSRYEPDGFSDFESFVVFVIFVVQNPL